jgi:hypothetical protein
MHVYARTHTHTHTRVNRVYARRCAVGMRVQIDKLFTNTYVQLAKTYFLYPWFVK